MMAFLFIALFSFEPIGWIPITPLLLGIIRLVGMMALHCCGTMTITNHFSEDNKHLRPSPWNYHQDCIIVTLHFLHPHSEVRLLRIHSKGWPASRTAAFSAAPVNAGLFFGGGLSPGSGPWLSGVGDSSHCSSTVSKDDVIFACQGMKSTGSGVYQQDQMENHEPIEWRSPVSTNRLILVILGLSNLGVTSFQINATISSTEKPMILSPVGPLPSLLEIDASTNSIPLIFYIPLDPLVWYWIYHLFEQSRKP